MKPTETKPSSQRSKIVIVEDQPEIRLLLRMTLEINDYEIFEAGDAQMGLHLIERVEPDLILLDVMMPGEINGFILCEMLKSTSWSENIPIIFLTGADSDEDRKAGLQSGASHYLVKPFLPEKVVSLCEEILGEK